MTVQECPRPLAGAIRVERAERHPVNAQGMVEGSSVMRQDVTIVNLSRSGCLLRGTVDLLLGEQISILIPRVGHRLAHVQRGDGTSYGCSFDQLLHASEVEAACALPEPEDVSAVRRRIREAVARNTTENEEKEPEGLGSRIRSGLRRLGRRNTTK